MRFGEVKRARIVGRVEERVEQRHLRCIALSVEHRQRLPYQRMPEPVSGNRELVRDSCIHFRIVLGEAVIALTSHATKQLVGKVGVNNALIFSFVNDLGSPNSSSAVPLNPASSNALTWKL